MTPILFWILLSLLISIITLGIGIQKREAPKSHYFIILALVIIAYTMGRAVESSATVMETAYVGVILAYCGSPYIPAVMLSFLWDYYDINIKKRFQPLLYIIPALSTVCVVIPELRHFYYIDYSFFAGPPIAQIMVQGSFFYYVTIGYHFLLLGLCLALSLWGAIKLKRTERWSSMTIFVAVLAPMIFHLLYLLKITPLGLDLNPIALCFSLGMFAVAVYSLNLLRMVPLAKDVILEQMSDAFIIVDTENRYLEANATAKSLFSALPEMHVGEKLNVQDLFHNVTEGLDGQTLVSVLLDGKKQYYHLAETEIEQNKKKQCTCYTLHDITDARNLMAELRTMATYDSLTNVYNRASFYQLGSQALDRAREQRVAVSVFGIDIDHFKEINDGYGHFCGDEILKCLVEKISGRLRKADIFGRVGGDEFNILLPNTNIENAIGLAEGLQHMVSSQPCVFRDQEIHVTISIGVAVFDEYRHENLESLLMDVDKALYVAKNTGRDRVEFYCPDWQ